MALVSWAQNSILGMNPRISEPSPVEIGHTLSPAKEHCSIQEIFQAEFSQKVNS